MKVDVNRAAFERVRSAADLLTITLGDLQGPILTRVAQVHRSQERRIFASEGTEGRFGRWPALSPDYAKRKKKLRPGRKILVWSGDMKDRFITPSRPENVEEFVPRGLGGTFRLGAVSEIAGYHFRGGSSLPMRDMVTKTREQVLACWQAIVTWYQKERIPQAQRALRTGAGGRRR